MKQRNKQKKKIKAEFATAKEKLYENCKIVKLYEKKDGATDWPNKDVEAQSNSNHALCNIQARS